MKVDGNGRRGWCAVGTVLALLLSACNNPGATTSTFAEGSPGSTNPTHGGGSSGHALDPAHQFAVSAFDPDGFGPGAGGTDGGGQGGEGPIVAPYGISTICGDAIVGADEECDDGAGGADACTAECQTRDEPAVANDEQEGADRYLGAGRHPIAGLNDGFVTTYVGASEDEPSVGATLFNIWGQPAHQVLVSDGASPIYEANPVAAALPGGTYAVAWSDFDGDGSDLGIALRLVAANGSLGSLRVANSGREFSQLNPDVIWTGSELIVAWEDYADAANGPDLRYRTFDAELNPTSSDLVLSESALPEAAVALASFNGGWAAAYREGLADGSENVVVRAGDDSFRFGPVQGGPLDDRPALVELDATHLLVVFSAGTDPGSSGTYSVPRLRYAVIDTEEVSAPTFRALDPLDDVFSHDNHVSHLSPSAVRGPEGIYVAWRSEARPGDASGDQVWLKHLSWTNEGGTWRLRVGESEMLAPRTCDGSAGDQRAPALASTQLPPNGALAMAWTDYGRTQGAGEPDVVVHYAPTHHTSTAGVPQQLVETWSGATGSGFPARWSTNAAAHVTYTTQYGEGEFSAFSEAGSAFALVNDHTAQNVDLVTTMRFGYPNFGALIARADSDTSPSNYVGALVHTKKADTWRLFSVVNGVTTNLQSLLIPKGFWETGIGVGVDYRVRLRVLTNPDATLFLGMKVWRLGAMEPAAWLLQTTLPTSSPTVQALGGAAGRFGISANIATANGGRIYFDDFSATFFEGEVAGNLDLASSSPPLLLPRSLATYRRCNGTSPCTQTEGCCSGDDDCAEGLACSHYQSQGLGLGSHAAICVADHCADRIKNDNEVRADCGGPDCKACECASSVALGVAGYCSALSPGCLCGQGEYPCSRNAQCLPGLICGVDTGEPFNAPFGTDACVPPHCVNRVQDADETLPDCGGSCGSNCGVCSPTNGATGHCRVYCPCSIGEGLCSQDDECAASLVCAAKGTRFGFTTNINVCVAAHCLNNSKDAGLGETSVDCGGECGCGGCPAGCQ